MWQGRLKSWASLYASIYRFANSPIFLHPHPALPRQGEGFLSGRPRRAALRLLALLPLAGEDKGGGATRRSQTISSRAKRRMLSISVRTLCPYV